MLNKKLDFDLADEWQDEMCDWEDDNTAFIKHDISGGKSMWSIYAADGERIATTDNREYAFIVARQNDLEPFSVH